MHKLSQMQKLNVLREVLSMKKKLAVILASAMAVSLTACGGSKAPETTAATDVFYKGLVSA